MKLNIQAAFEDTPPELDFVWPGLLAGTVGALIAPGGVGKSFWALQVAISVATGGPAPDLIDLRTDKARKVIYLAAEDPGDILRLRLHAIGKNLSRSEQILANKWLSVIPIAGTSIDVMSEKHRAKLVQDSEGSRLIILDTLSRFHQLDENSNSEMAQLLRSLETVAAKAGSAVLFLHHSSKSGIRDGYIDQQHSARGASSLIDNARWCGYMVPMTERESNSLSETPFGNRPICPTNRKRFIRFGVSKQNYGARPDDRWYKRNDDGLLSPVQLFPISPKKSKTNKSKADNDYSG